MSAPSASIASLRAAILAVWPGTVIGGIGDTAHQAEVSDHNPDDTPGVKAAQTDPDSRPEWRALDVMLGPTFNRDDGHALVRSLIGDRTAQGRLFCVIFDRLFIGRSTRWDAVPYEGSDPHTGHVHISGWAGDDENGADWPTVRALGASMTMADVTDGLADPQPWKSPGAQAHAQAHGEGGEQSLRKMVEWLLDSVRYGAFPADHPGFPVRLAEPVQAVVDQAMVDQAVRTALSDPQVVQPLARAVIDELHNRL